MDTTPSLLQSPSATPEQVQIQADYYTATNAAEEQLAEAFVVDIDGFEGSLDLLLAMARTQKVDLTGISVLALAEQYLAFVGTAHELRLELAADYLTMAAWLTYLKSRLLLPEDEVHDDAPSGEELAQRLAFRLMRLNAMRDAADQFMSRDRLGRDVFARGRPEQNGPSCTTYYTADLFDLLKAYATQRKRTLPRVHVVRKRTVWSIKDARVRLERLIEQISGTWLRLDQCLQNNPPPPQEDHRTVAASCLGAALEMAREGVIEIRQERAFGPVFVRCRETSAPRQSGEEHRLKEQQGGQYDGTGSGAKTNR